MSVIFYNRGIIYKHLNELDLAVKDFASAIKFNNKYEHAYLARGNIFRA
jgi:tetratricopeptide (TPR) repeat protein